MSNFQIIFEPIELFGMTFHPQWLLFLLIPAVFFTLLPYFLLNKKYRRTRNRVTSIILHLIVITLAILVLSGMTFSYEVPNRENEILLLVDLSQSNEEREADRDAFIRAVLDESDENFKVGIVTFGFDQVLAAEFDYDTDKVYEDYLEAALPDTSATDIAAALEFAKEQFEHPHSGKIVLITDGVETDGTAANAIGRVAGEGIRVDTVLFPNDRHDEVQLIGVQTPDHNIVAGEEFTMTLSVQSSYRGGASVSIYDNDVLSGDPLDVDLIGGIQNIEIKHVFDSPGLHRLQFSIESESDTLMENNSFQSYINLEVFDKLLVIERFEDESLPLRQLLDQRFQQCDYCLYSDTDKLPKTDDEIRQYDQVILVNIANRDLKNMDGFDVLLQRYVRDYGGGLLTVGGNIENEKGEMVANTYNMEDMAGSVYQDMLPVQAINYTPPIGVMIIIDRSGSMSTEVDPTVGDSKLDLAKQGARACLNALSERDYCGVITLEDEYVEDIELTPMTEMDKIIAAIDRIEIGDGTVYRSAIEGASEALRALSRVERRHIILVTDGEPSDEFEDYAGMIDYYYRTSGITFSIVGISVGDYARENMEAAAEYGHGRFYNVTDVSKTPGIMREELNVDEIKAFNPEPFQPEITAQTSVVTGVRQEEIPMLNGYFGTRVKRAGVEVSLSAPYVPLYAQWDYGKGKVGSFMCDLSGYWSGDFMNDSTGVRLIYNIVSGIFPTENIRQPEITTRLTEENYRSQLSIYTGINEGETVEVTVTPLDPYSTAEPLYPELSADEHFSRCTLLIKSPGVYEVLIQKKDALGEVIAEVRTYKSFSYSAEYNVFVDAEACRVLLERIAESGNGRVVENAWEVFEDYVKTLQRSFDPRLLFLIVALVLFLLDIAVRKFKFKWPHELVRDYKAKKQLKQQSQ